MSILILPLLMLLLLLLVMLLMLVLLLMSVLCVCSGMIEFNWFGIPYVSIEAPHRRSALLQQ